MGLIEEASRTLVDKIADQLLLRLMRDPYVENVWEIISTTMKVRPRDLMEIVLRAEKGKPLGRPFGTVYHFSPWQDVLFNPVHLVRLPTEDKNNVETKVTLGPRAQRPLELAIPIIISGMSYGGAISKQARIALAKAATAPGRHQYYRGLSTRGTGAGGEIHLPIPPRPMAPWE